MSTSRISGFVGGTQKNPLPLDEKELEKIVQQIDSGAQQAVLEEEYVVGQKVMISEGPFNNFNGSIDEINREKRKLKVLVSIFGRPTPVEIEFDKVKSI
jgi:transcriptional antiterminator NusG